MIKRKTLGQDCKGANHLTTPYLRIFTMLRNADVVRNKLVNTCKMLETAIQEGLLLFFHINNKKALGDV